MRYLITLCTLLFVTIVIAQLSAQDELRSVFNLNCQRACFYNIQVGVTSETDLINFLNSQSLVYTVVYPTNSPSSASYVFDTNITFTKGRMQIDVINGIVTNISIPLNVSTNDVIGVFGYPNNVTFDSSTPLYVKFLEYPNFGLVFQVNPSNETLVNSIFLNNFPIQNGKFSVQYGATLVPNNCPNTNSPICLLPTATLIPTPSPTPVVTCKTTISSGNSAGSPYMIC